MSPDVLRRAYDAGAAQYDARFTDQQRPKIEALLARTPRWTPALDLGCGTGLAQRITGRPFIGLDFSRGMLAQGGGPRVQADAARMPFADATFVLVLSVTALIDFTDPRPQVAEVRRVLQTGGCLALSVLKHERIEALTKGLGQAGFQIVERLDLKEDWGFIAWLGGR